MVILAFVAQEIGDSGASFLVSVGAVVQLVLATFAKMGVQVGFSVLGVHVNEIYPTRVRGIALGTCITISRIGAILSPFTHDQVLCRSL